MLDLKVMYNVPFCLTGDFNARTGLLDDFMTIEDIVSDLSGFNASNDNSDLKSYFRDKGFETKRHNMDECVNNNGVKLLDLCQSFDLKIANGRLGNDKGVGNFTCYNKNGGRSVVDYVIASVSIFEHISKFEIDVFDKCMSDVHCLLSFSLGIGGAADDCKNESSNVFPEPPKQGNYLSFKWSTEKASNFKSNLDNHVKNVLDNLGNAEGNITQDSMDSLCSLLSDSFINAAIEADICKKKAYGTSRPLTKLPNQENKPWFDHECKQARDMYFQNKNRLKRKRKGMQGQEREDINVDLAKASGVYIRSCLGKKGIYKK